MAQINKHIDYIEFKAIDLDLIKKFYSQVFGWTFTDYGPNYTAFENAGISGGFEKSRSKITNGVLVVLYYTDLKDIRQKITAYGGKISLDIFSFPGGHRFHFLDPSGNELAVWSES